MYPNYTQIISELDKYPLHTHKWTDGEKFKKLLKKRNLQYLDTVLGDLELQFEVWGNNLFHLIVKHDMVTNKYCIV